MTETMRYVHVAEQHRREIPPIVTQAGAGIIDSEKRVLAMLSARGAVDWRGNDVATDAAGEEEVKPLRLFS